MRMDFHFAAVSFRHCAYRTLQNALAAFREDLPVFRRDLCTPDGGHLSVFPKFYDLHSEGQFYMQAG